MRRVHLSVGAVVLAVSVTAGCGIFSDPAATKAASATVTSSVVSPTPTVASTSASATPSSTASVSSTPAAGGTGGTILSPTVVDRNLTTADAFALSGRWKDDRYNVAALQDVKGMGAPVGSCSAADLELRLENAFDTLSFSVGQGNASESSSEILKVEVLGDQRQVDIRQINFNQIQDFSVPVTGINSLKIHLSIARSGSCSRSVQAVLMNMKLS